MEVLTFGVTREIIGHTKLTLKESFSTVGALRTHLVSSYPELDKLNSLTIAVNEVYAEDSDVLNGNDVVALIPPVSGG